MAPSLGSSSQHVPGGRRRSRADCSTSARRSITSSALDNSSLLLADEPTSHQDATHAAVVMTAIARAAAEGAGVIVASHDPAAVEVADRIIEFDL